MIKHNAILEVNLKKIETKWKSCDTLYFETNIRTIRKPIIGLIAERDALINNIFYHSSILSKSTGKKQLLSVTVLKQHNLTKEELKIRVQKELQTYCGIDSCRLIKHYTIPVL